MKKSSVAVIFEAKSACFDGIGIIKNVVCTPTT